MVQADYAQSQFNSFRAPTDSVWSTSYKTERMVLGGWESINLSHFVYMLPAENSATPNEKAEVDLWQLRSDSDPYLLVGNSYSFTMMF